MKENEKSFGFLAHESVAQQSFKLASMGTSEWVTQELFAGHSSLFSGIRQLHFFFFFCCRAQEAAEEHCSLHPSISTSSLFELFFYFKQRRDGW